MLIRSRFARIEGGAYERIASTVGAPKPFEIGLVMAGPISAGAYTAGVMDFLIQALHEWQKAKNANQDVPRHEVKLRAMTGSPAGGMTVAISVGALATQCPPAIDATADNAANKLFDSWVNRIDIASLLETKDLEDKKAPVRSILDSTVLKSIADNALDVTPVPKPRPYISDALCLSSRWWARRRTRRSH